MEENRDMEVAMAIGALAADTQEKEPDITPEEFADRFSEVELEELCATREEIIEIARGALDA